LMCWCRGWMVRFPLVCCSVWVLLWHFVESMVGGLRSFSFHYKRLFRCCLFLLDSSVYPAITYYWTVPLILDHSYLVGK
jgi:hypothetical protein